MLYIGAGAVAAGGIISYVPGAAADCRVASAGSCATCGSGATTADARRFDERITICPLWGRQLGAVLLVLAIWADDSRSLGPRSLDNCTMNVLGRGADRAVRFLFVTVSSRLTGEIGSSSNPISGMTVATLLLTCLVFLSMGKTNPADRLTAMTVAAVVCIAASNGGTTSQDLKTGFLVGATPR